MADSTTFVRSSILSVLFLAGCATLPEIPEGLEKIAFEPQPPPFCGRCETTNFVAVSDGRVWIERGYWVRDHKDWRVSRRLVHTSPEQFVLLRERLEPYKSPRSTGSSETDCGSYISDNDGAIVTWSSNGVETRRVFDFGCLDDREMNDAVRNAHDVLGIENW